MSKDQQGSQVPPTMMGANQLLQLDDLMVMYALCAFSGNPPSPVNNLPSPSASPPSLLYPDATALDANTGDLFVSGFPLTTSNMPLQPPQPSRPSPLPMNAATTTTATAYPTHLYRCQWTGCHLEFNEPKTLLAHLSEDHVGRRQRGNLNLSCQWTGCTRVAHKRDHMISHLKSHVPFWPHLCNICGNRFKHTTGLNRHLNRHNERGETNLTTAEENGALNKAMA